MGVLRESQREWLEEAPANSIIRVRLDSVSVERYGKSSEGEWRSLTNGNLLGDRPNKLGFEVVAIGVTEQPKFELMHDEVLQAVGIETRQANEYRGADGVLEIEDVIPLLRELLAFREAK